jgi:hypothetical protein
MMNTTTTLTEAVKALYAAHPRITVIQLVNDLSVNQPHLKADYRKVYNTFKRINGSAKAPKVEKSSIIFDLTLAPAATVKGTIFKRGQHCK